MLIVYGCCAFCATAQNSDLNDSLVKYGVTSFSNGWTGHLYFSVDQRSRSCIVSGYLNNTNKTHNAFMGTSLSLSTCIERGFFPVQVEALEITLPAGQKIVYKNLDGSSPNVELTNQVSGNNYIHCAFVVNGY